MTKIKRKLGVIERFMLPNPEWQEGYKAFNRLFDRPLGWLFLTSTPEENQLIRLDRKDHCSFYAKSKSNQQSLETFLIKYCEQILLDPERQQKLPAFFRDVFGRTGVIFCLMHLGRPQGFLILTSLSRPEKAVKDFVKPLDHFLAAEVELAFKNFELNNFYETVHPRALALSTMHSVHRVISSSVRLNDLLPRIGRLSAQVLKARGCSILLVDSEREYLVPSFYFGSHSRFVHKQRIRIGRGLEGKMVDTGQFHLSRRSIGVPFVEDDVVGVIILWDKVDNQPFTRTDLEILKSLSEHAVVAIKNAQLFEETEQLTLGSIKTINDLLELNFGADRRTLPIFGEIVIEVGKKLELSGRDLIHLQRAIMLRDAGTLALPERVLAKKGRLTKKERALLKRIPMRGANLLRSISSLKPVTPIILHHRERFDGKGYPAGLAGQEIPIGARIVSVVDSFVAMCSERSYRRQKTMEQALKEIQANSGTQFDPRVVECFLKVVRRKDIMEKIKRALSRTPKAGSRIKEGT